MPLLAPAVQLLPEQKGTLEAGKKRRLSVSQVIKLPSFLSFIYIYMSHIYTFLTW